WHESAPARARLADILQTDGAASGHTEQPWTDKRRPPGPAEPDRTAPGNRGQHQPDGGLFSSNPRRRPPPAFLAPGACVSRHATTHSNVSLGVPDREAPGVSP